MKVTVTKAKEPWRKKPNLVTWYAHSPVTGRLERHREFFETKRDADARKAKLKSNAGTDAGFTDTLSDREKAELRMAFAIAGARKTSLLDAVKAWDAGQGASPSPDRPTAPHATTLPASLSHAPAKTTALLPIEQAQILFVKDRKAMGRRRATIDSYAGAIGLFASHWPKEKWQTISAADYGHWLKHGGTRGETAAASLARNLRAFFRWSKEHGTLGNLALANFKFKTATTDKEIEFLTVKECQGLIAASDSESRPAIVLGLFAGVRPEETAKMDWSMVRWKEKRIRIPKEVAKTRKARIIENIPDALWKHLAPWKGTAAGPIAPLVKVVRRKASGTVPDEVLAMRRLRGAIQRARARAAKAKTLTRWPQDCLRHSFITYLCAATQNLGHVARVSGTGLTMIDNNYDGMTEKENGEAYFAIKPVAL